MRGPVVTAAIGAAFFAWLAGPQLLDPTSIDWLMKGDWVPHHFGWHYFRIEPWHWPPGRILGYYAPLGTSVGLTDSVPIAAYVLKPLSPWLPVEFQYLGPWLLLCFALQGLLGARLIQRWSSSLSTQILGGTLFVLLPTLLARVGHAALTAHWLLLWTLLLATRPINRRHRPWEWMALGLVAGMTQPYLAAMVLALASAGTLAGPGAPFRARVRTFASVVVATATGWWLSGLFILPGTGALAEGGLGYYSMNLAAFVTPSGWSRWWPEIPVATDGQTFEGFHYLGVGILGLLAAAVGLTTRTAKAPTAPPWSRWMVAVAVAMTLFALSPRVTLGPYVLADATGPWAAPLAMFRASSRFAWPLTYLLLTWAIVTVDRRSGSRAGAVILGLAVLLQIADLSAAFRLRHDAARDPAFHAWEDPFASARWDQLLPHYRHLVLAPPPQCGPAPVAYAPAMRLAARHGVTINAGVVTRGDVQARDRYCTEADARLDRADLRDDSLYVVDGEGAAVLSAEGGARVTCGQIDAVWLCTTATARASWPDGFAFDP